MFLGPTFVLYFLVGLAVAVAVYAAEADRRPAERGFMAISAIGFWPIYLPVLLAPQNERKASIVDATPKDELSDAIRQVQLELQGALHSLNGKAESLHEETKRLPALHDAWVTQSNKIREMDRLLALPEFTEASGATGNPTTDDRWKQTMELRQQNIDRLRRLRKEARDDLLATLAWVRELISMIHLAKFTGAPATRIQELLRQVAQASDRLSEITVQGEKTGPAGGNT